MGSFQLCFKRVRSYWNRFAAYCAHPLALGHIPPQWETVRVTFIPKPGRSSHCVAKDFRPISLSSFVLKTLERLVDLYVKEEVLSRFLLYRNQHAYQMRKSTDSALHGIVARVEKYF